MICDISNQDLDFLGYLVIDSNDRGKFCGGVRMTTEVTLDEIISLAKNMTLKCGFLGVPLGGAKVGIRIRGSLSKMRRKLIFTDIGKSLSPLVTRGCYYPTGDMGTTNEDIDCLLNSATQEKKNWKHSPTPVYTSWTMLVSAVEALDELELKLDESIVAIQGFGEVGSSAAKVFSENGAKIVAISTRKGAIYDSKGLNVTELLEMKKEFGDDIVNIYAAARKIARNDLLYLPVDILLPCAGSWTINLTNSYKIRSKIVCPGANIPITDEAEENLFRKRITSIPDFVSNSGGVLGSFMGSLVTEWRKKEIIERGFSKRVSELIKISKETNVSPKKVAKRIAMERFNKVKAKSEKTDVKEQIYQKVKDIILKVYMEIYVKPKAPKIYAKMLHSTG